MIYIFDDRAQRRKDNEESLRRYSDYIKFMTVNLIPGKSIEESIIDSIDNPECIIFHKSYVFEDQSVSFENIRELFMSFDVPIVIFSGGLEGNNKGLKEINMNADLMYENLPYFIDYLKEKKELNIDALLWGKKYELNALLQFQNLIAKIYFINNNMNDNIENLSDVKRSLRQSSRKLRKEFRDELLLIIDRHEFLKWQDLADRIDQIIQKYK